MLENVRRCSEMESTVSGNSREQLERSTISLTTDKIQGCSNINFQYQYHLDIGTALLGYGSWYMLNMQIKRRVYVARHLVS